VAGQSDHYNRYTLQGENEHKPARKAVGEGGHAAKNKINPNTRCRLCSMAATPAASWNLVDGSTGRNVHVK
jgi:hypothetical protein